MGCNFKFSCILYLSYIFNLKMNFCGTFSIGKKKKRFSSWYVRKKKKNSKLVYVMRNYLNKVSYARIKLIKLLTIYRRIAEGKISLVVSKCV